MAMNNLRIIRLEAENVKRLVAVEITPKGDVVEITGKNGNGKTSVLDSILWALAGGRSIQWKPIREGEEKAFISIDLGNEDGLQLQVTRRFNAQEDGSFTTSLKVVNAEGFKPAGEQTLLNSIIGALSFDPGEFMRAQPEAQVSMLKDLIPGVDFDKIAARRKALFEERTEVNRDVKRTKAQLDALPAVPANTPAEPVDASELISRIEAVSQANMQREREVNRRSGLRGSRDRAYDQRDHIKGEAERLRQRAAELEADADEWNRKGVEAEEELVSLPALEEPQSADELREALRTAERTNEWVRIQSAAAAVADSLAELEAKAAELTAGIEAADQEIVDGVASAKLPVSGMAIREDMVFLRGVPFNQASDAEQLRASMALAMAANPRLRVIRIRNGSLLDEDALAVVREVAAAENFQIWIERVGSGGDDAIVMENGEIKGA